MIEKKLLSICIPTFNRVEFLQYNLKSITDQFDKEPSLKDLVEIVISDNASSDGTKEMVASFLETYNNITYVRNTTNIGFDRNVNNAVHLANGTYCLTLGDDDALFPNSLSVLTKKILNTNVPYYLVGHVGYSRDMQHANAHEHVSEDCSYDSLEDYVRSLEGYVNVIGIFGGMSTHVFLRNIWVSYSELDKYIDTLQIHTHVFLRAFKHKKVMVFHDAIVKTRGDNMRWEDIVGLETTHRRNIRAFRDFMWIKHLYELTQSKFGAFVYFMGRGYWIVLKGLVKKILFFIKCDKLFYKLKQII
jgi:glycosyltransferase involved in cell wall biosynthesis